MTNIPQALDAERSVLGAILSDIDKAIVAMEKVDESDFFIQEHQIIFRNIKELIKENKDIDIITVSNNISTKYKKNISEVFLSDLVAESISNGSWEDYIEIIKEKSKLRKIYDRAKIISSIALKQEQESSQILNELSDFILSLNTEQKNSNTMSDLTDSVYKKLSYIQSGGVLESGVMVGIQKLDEMTNGLSPGMLAIMAARPSQGKSLVAGQMAYNAAKFGYKTMLFSLEMSAQEICERMIASAINVNSWKIRNGKLNPHEYDKFVNNMNELKNIPLLIDDTSGSYITIDTIIAKTKREKMTNGLDFVIVDYLGLVGSSDNRQKNETRHLELGGFAKSLKNLARELKIPVLCLHQINRGVEDRQDKRPQLQDLRECFTGDTKVFDHKTRMELSFIDIYNSNSTCNLEVIDENMNIKIVNDLKLYNTGSKKIYNITLKSGDTVKASTNSKLLKLNNWVDIKDLKVGDFISRCNYQNRLSSNILYDKDLLFVIGFFIANGYINNDLSVTTNDDSIGDILSRILNKYGLKVKNRKRFGCNMFSIRKDGNCYRNYLKSIFKDIGLFGKHSYEKFIPECFKNLTKEETLFLLKGLYQGDGSFTGRKLKYSSTSLKLIKDIHYLWRTLGINSNIQKPYTKKKENIVNNRAVIQKHPLYELCIGNNFGVNFFKENIGFYGKKQTKFINDYNKEIRKTNIVQNMPPEIIDILFDAKGNKTWKDFGYVIQKGSNGYKIPSKDYIKKIAEKNSNEYLLKIANSPIEYEEIVGIEYIGEEDTYDFEVPKYHNFLLSNGIVAHNSGQIEEHADMVIMLYRESYYQQEDNSTLTHDPIEFVIRKYRNGSIGFFKAFVDLTTQKLYNE